MQRQSTNLTDPKVTRERVETFIRYYKTYANETFSEDALEVFSGYIHSAESIARGVEQLSRVIQPVLSEANKKILQEHLSLRERLYFDALTDPLVRKQMSKLKEDKDKAETIEAQERVEKVVKLYRNHPAYFDHMVVRIAKEESDKEGSDKEESEFQNKFIDALKRTALAHVLGGLNPIQYVTMKLNEHLGLHHNDTKNEPRRLPWHSKLDTAVRNSIEKEMNKKVEEQLGFLLKEYQTAIGNLTSDPSRLEKFFTKNPIMTTFILGNSEYLEKCARLYQKHVEEENTQFLNDYTKTATESIVALLKTKMPESEASTAYSRIVTVISAIDKGLPSNQYKQQVEMVVSNQLHFYSIRDLVIMKLEQEFNIPKESVKDALLKDLIDKIKLKSKDVSVYHQQYVQSLNEVISNRVSSFVKQNFSGNILGKAKTVTHFAPSNPLEQMIKRLNSNTHEKVRKTLEEKVDLKNLIELFLNCKIENETGKDGVDSFIKCLLELCAFDNPIANVLEVCLQFKDSPISKFFKSEELNKISSQIEILAKNYSNQNIVRK